MTERTPEQEREYRQQLMYVRALQIWHLAWFIFIVGYSIYQALKIFGFEAWPVVIGIHLIIIVALALYIRRLDSELTGEMTKWDYYDKPC